MMHRRKNLNTGEIMVSRFDDAETGRGRQTETAARSSRTASSARVDCVHTDTRHQSTGHVKRPRLYRKKIRVDHVLIDPVKGKVQGKGCVKPLRLVSHGLASEPRAYRGPASPRRSSGAGSGELDSDYPERATRVPSYQGAVASPANPAD